MVIDKSPATLVATLNLAFQSDLIGSKVECRPAGYFGSGYSALTDIDPIGALLIDQNKIVTGRTSNIDRERSDHTTPVRFTDEVDPLQAHSRHAYRSMPSQYLKRVNRHQRWYSGLNLLTLDPETIIGCKIALTDSAFVGSFSWR